MNYEKIKMIAAERKCKTDSLLALARNNDPFYIGTEAHRRDAEWFAGIWHDFGYHSVREVHLRRIHYRLVSQEKPVLTADGKPYENTDRCWSYLANASKYARYLKLVDPAAFDDRRNGKPQIFFEETKFEPGVEVYSSLDIDIRLPDLPDLPEYHLHGFIPEQPYHLEIWCEKSTMNDVLLPLCNRYGANLITGLGEFSLTACLWLVERVNKIGKPCRIFYISDFDPAGQSMPVAVSRKIEKFIIDYGAPGLDIKLLPLALTLEQTRKYELPRTPIKETERRAASFEDRFGAGATELDALEALYPGELRKIIEEAMLGYYDQGLAVRVLDIETEQQNYFDEIRRSVLSDHRDDITAVSDLYSEITEDFQERIDALKEEIWRVWQAIHDDLVSRKPYLGEYELDISPGFDACEALFDSNRDYFDQLTAYKKFQGK